MLRSPHSPVLLVFLVVFSAGLSAQGTGTIRGRLTVVDEGNRLAHDVGQAVVWLESSRSFPVQTSTHTVIMSDKEFRPHVVATTVGSTVAFPNEDPFNHNAFSRSRMGEFDLGLYGRGGTRATNFSVPGVYRIYCNVHPTMSAFAVVRDNPFFAQPSADGSFEIANVPAGVYTVVAWHERAGEVRHNVEVTSSGGSVTLELDARGFQPEEHLNKYGKPYRRRGRRY